MKFLAAENLAMLKNNKNKIDGQIVLWSAIIILCAILTIFTASWLFGLRSNGRLAKNIWVGDLAVGEMNMLEARQALEARIDKAKNDSWQFRFEGKEAALNPTIQATTDPDVVYELATYDTDATLKLIYSANNRRRFRLSQKTIKVPVVVSVKQDQLKQALLENFSNLEIQPVELGFAYKQNSTDIIVTPPVSGHSLNEAVVVEQITNALRQFQVPDIELQTSVKKSAISVADVSSEILQTIAVKMKQNMPLVLQSNEQSWEFEAARILPYLTLRNEGSALTIALKDNFIQDILKPIQEEVDRPAIASRFKIENGRAILWQPPQDGLKVDIEKTLLDIIEAINSPETQQVTMTIAVDPAPPIDGEGRDMGIVEAIGVGRSNFAGSPKNRRHNIKVGADSLNGVLIKPDEEFSLIKTLGEIDAAHGYLPELVIKGNKTIPEFGGGLCQIGTTTFRAALASGLPILERQNHSYRVVYYEPAGTDATIYDPKPDFRFLNDTGRYILIQTKIEGDNLIFEFWGTKDGRIVEQTKPKIYNITKPPEKKIIETLDLPPGEQKCTEKPHNGADAEFTYTVTYLNGDKKEQLFKSHYRPWQEVCLLGVEELTPDPGETTPISTDVSPAPETALDSPATVEPN